MNPEIFLKMAFEIGYMQALEDKQAGLDPRFISAARQAVGTSGRQIAKVKASKPSWWRRLFGGGGKPVDPAWARVHARVAG